MRILFLVFLTLASLFGASLSVEKWGNGETFLTFLEKHNLPLKTYYDLDKEDKTLTQEIYAGTRYEMLIDENGTLLQALIPVGDQLQLHIYADRDDYRFTVTPILLDYQEHAFSFTLETSPYNDILHHTRDRFLAQEFVWAFKNSLNFKMALRKGDTIALIYRQAYRSGQKFGYPQIQTAYIEVQKRPNAIYLNSDGRYYNPKGSEIAGFMLGAPVPNVRITSYFTLRRFHPILKRYRAHLGVDYGAVTGTPIYAAADGRIAMAAYNEGYGNVVKISHIDGYMTLYAHMSRFKKGLHKGQSVKKGALIGYVGSTGLSTGPHLHFSLYKNGQARNPLGVIRITTKQLKGKEMESFQAIKTSYDNAIQSIIAQGIAPTIAPPLENVCYLGARNPMALYMYAKE